VSRSSFLKTKKFIVSATLALGVPLASTAYAAWILPDYQTVTIAGVITNSSGNAYIRISGAPTTWGCSSATVQFDKHPSSTGTMITHSDVTINRMLAVANAAYVSGSKVRIGVQYDSAVASGSRDCYTASILVTP
jgi:hypothetical protein